MIRTSYGLESCYFIRQRNCLAENRYRKTLQRYNGNIRWSLHMWAKSHAWTNQNNWQKFYRHLQGLITLQKCNRQRKMKKVIPKIIKTIGVERKGVDFKDIQFTSRKGKFQPYRKPSNRWLYIHTYSKHLPVIIRQISQPINGWLFDNFSHEHILNETKTLWNINPYIYTKSDWKINIMF